MREFSKIIHVQPSVFLKHSLAKNIQIPLLFVIKTRRLLPRPHEINSLILITARIFTDLIILYFVFQFLRYKFAMYILLSSMARFIPKTGDPYEHIGISMNTRRTSQTNYVNVLETCSCYCHIAFFRIILKTLLSTSIVRQS